MLEGTELLRWWNIKQNDYDGGQIFGNTANTTNCLITARQLRNFEYARRAAEMSTFRVQVGAVAVAGKKILSTGWNSSKSHTTQYRFDQYRNFRNDGLCRNALHAEIACLIPLLHNPEIDWSRVEVYVYRIRKDQPFGMARPCAACMRALLDAGVRNIYYTSNNALISERIA